MDMRKLSQRECQAHPPRQRHVTEQLAERSGFSQQYISDLERGRRNPTVVSLFELAQALGTTPVQLITPNKDTAMQP